MTNPTPIWLIAACLLCAAQVTSAADFGQLPVEERMVALFQPMDIDRVVLSPDGKRIALTAATYQPSIVVIDLDAKTRTQIIPKFELRSVNGLSEDGMALADALPSMPILYLDWLSPTTLVYLSGKAVRAVNVDGTGDRRILDQFDIGIAVAGRGGSGAGGGMLPRAPHVQGFDPSNPGSLIVTTPQSLRANRTEYANGVDSYRVDALTGRLTPLGLFAEPGILLFDRQGRARINQTSPTAFAPASKGFSGTEYAQSEGVRFRYRTGLKSEPVHPLFGMRAWDDLGKFIGGPSAGIRFNYHADDFFQPRAIPLGFGADPNILYYASNLGRDTVAVFALDLQKKTSTLVAEDPASDLADVAKARITGELGDAKLIFSRAGTLAGIRVAGFYSRTLWLDPAIAKFQRRIDDAVTNANSEIIAWDDAAKRFVVSITSTVHPGAYAVVEDAAEPQPLTAFPRSNWPVGAFNPSQKFEFDSPAGVHLTGTITRPLKSRVEQAPLVVFCHDLPGQPSDVFNRSTQALATLGFFVIEVNYRGSVGYGTAFREALRKNFDAPIEDFRAAIDWVAGHYLVDRTRVALVGEGLGGYFAIRAAELYPGEFRAVVGRGAPRSISDWVSYGPLFNIRSAYLPSVDKGDYSLARHADALRSAVLLIADGDRESNARINSLASALESETVKPEIVHRAAGLEYVNEPRGDVEINLRIGRFLNEALFDFGVKIEGLQPADSPKARAK